MAGEITFKRYYKNTKLIGTGTIKFRPYTVAEPSKLTYKLSVGDGSRFVDVSTGKELGYINIFEYDKTYKIYTTNSTYKYVVMQNKDGKILSVAQGTSANAPQIWSASDVGNTFAGLTFAKSTAYGTNRVYYFRVNLS